MKKITISINGNFSEKLRFGEKNISDLYAFFDYKNGDKSREIEKTVFILPNGKEVSYALLLGLSRICKAKNKSVILFSDKNVFIRKTEKSKRFLVGKNEALLALGDTAFCE